MENVEILRKFVVVPMNGLTMLINSEKAPASGAAGGSSRALLRSLDCVERVVRKGGARGSGRSRLAGQPAMKHGLIPAGLGSEHPEPRSQDIACVDVRLPSQVAYVEHGSLACLLLVLLPPAPSPRLSGRERASGRVLGSPRKALEALKPKKILVKS